MGQLSIKIKISDREYPMKVDSDEEERVRLAGKEINERLKTYRKEFGIDDKQDLLAMVAFDCLVDKMRAKESMQDVDEAVEEKVTYLNKLVTQSLQSS